MTVSRRSRLARALIVAAMALTFTAGIAEARAGRGGGGFGTRGARTYQAPPPTNTAPNAAAPINRSTQPAVNPAAAGGAATGGMFGRGGFMGGLAGGLLGAGLFGMLFGYGMFGGMGGLASILGLLLQIGIVFFIVRWAVRYFQSRNQPATAGAGAGTFRREMPNIPNVGGQNSGGMGGFGARPAPVATRPIEPTKADFDNFEGLLGTIQTAYGKGDMATLRANTTSEMAGYFGEELAADETRGLANRIGEVKLLQGDLSEAWREGDAEYATVAMRFSIVDYMVDRDSGKVVEGDKSRPVEATEIWTFQRPRGGVWLLSAIQAA